MTIYEVVTDCKTLENLINEETDPETGELRNISDEEKEAFLEWIKETEQNLETKMNNIYKVLSNKKAEAEVAEAERKALKDEMDRLSKRAKSRENEANRIKSLLDFALSVLQLKKYKTPLFSVGYQATAKSVRTDTSFNADNIPVEFLKRELSASAIKDAVSEGRLFEKDDPLYRGKLFYLNDKSQEAMIEGVSYLAGESLVVR